MKTPDILHAIKPVIDAFEKLSIPYYICKRWGEILQLKDLLTSAFHEAGFDF